MNKKYDNLRWASNNRGAEMGRINEIPYENEVIKLNLVRLPWVDGDYDPKGAYWGCGGRGQNIYWANGISACLKPINIFVRAVTRKDAKEQVREEMPRASFYK